MERGGGGEDEKREGVGGGGGGTDLSESYKIGLLFTDSMTCTQLWHGRAAAVVRRSFQEPVSPRLAKGQSPGDCLPCSCYTATVLPNN